jgi:hypothetical protein
VVDDEELRRELEEMVKDEKEAKRVEDVEARLNEGTKVDTEPTPVQQEMAVPAPASKRPTTVAAEVGAAESEEERRWRERYEDAQLRKKEEAARATAERMQKEARMAAE